MFFLWFICEKSVHFSMFFICAFHIEFLKVKKNLSREKKEGKRSERRTVG